MENDLLVFAIPVMPKSRSENWSEIESNLSNTVNSILLSSDSRVLAVIAHNERPSGAYWSDSRVVSIDLGISETTNGTLDKRQKRKAIGNWLRDFGYEGVYVMFLDADDLVNVNLSSYVLSDNNAQGYWVPHGYSFDCENLRGSPCFERFNYICGSCFIGYYFNDDFPESRTDNISVYSRICDAKHRDHHIIANELGKIVKPLPFLAVAYMMNHINSFAQKQENRKRGIAKGFFRSKKISKRYLERVFNFRFMESDDLTVMGFEKIRFILLDFYIKFRIKVKK